MLEGDLRRVSISQQDWSLHGQGSQDKARHDEIVRDAIKDNLGNILSDGAIITADPRTKRIVKVPIRSVELPHIRHKQGNGGIGTGTGEEKVGDILDARPADGQSGKEAGTDPGGESYDVEFTNEELMKMVFADMGLSNLTPKKNQQMETDNIVYEDVRKKRSPTNLDIMRTVYENMRRNAQEHGKAKLSGIRPDDYRVRTWRQEIREENAAVVIQMADISGSMGVFEKYMTRSIGWWGVQFLHAKYPRVDTVFVVHDTEAFEVNEADFFKRSDGGGTMCSSAAALSAEIIRKRYPTDAFNIYLQHYSDGGNFDSDNKKYVQIIQELLDMGISHFAYVNIGPEGSWGNLKSSLTNGIEDPRFLAASVKTKEDVWPTLKKIYDPKRQVAA